jgi:opacity protein-like surface antigen
MAKIVFITLACFLLFLTVAIQSTNASNGSLVKSGTIEFSTMSAFIGANLIGPGIGYLKIEGMSELMMSFDVGYFITPYTELEGSFGLMRTSVEFLDEKMSTTTSSFGGKFSLNLPTSGSPIIPYALVGIGLINSEDDSQSSLTFGGGLKIPMGVVEQLMARVEYLYNKSTEEGSEGYHTVALGFSVLFNLAP